MEGRVVDIKSNVNPDSSWEMVVGHHIVRVLPGIFGWEYVAGLPRQCTLLELQICQSFESFLCCIASFGCQNCDTEKVTRN